MDIVLEAKNMLEMLKLSGASGGCGSSSLFNPIIAKIDVKGKKLQTESPSQDKTTFMIAEFGWKDWKLKGDEDEIVLDVEVMSDWVKKLFPNDEKVVFEFAEGVLQMIGAKDTATLILEDIEQVKDSKMKMPIKISDDFLPEFKGKTIEDFKSVKLDVQELRKLVDRASLVYEDTDYYALKFSSKGSVAHIGSTTGKEPGIVTILDAKVKKSNDFEHCVGVGFREIVSSLDGEVEIFAIDGGYPLWIRQLTKEFKIGYMIAPVQDS